MCLAHGDWQSFSKRSVFRSSWESLGLREAYELQLRILQIKNFESDLLIFSDNSHHNSSGNAATRSQCLCIWPRMRLLLTPAARTEQEVAPEKKQKTGKSLSNFFGHVMFVFSIVEFGISTWDSVVRVLFHPAKCESRLGLCGNILPDPSSNSGPICEATIEAALECILSLLQPLLHVSMRLSLSIQASPAKETKTTHAQHALARTHTSAVCYDPKWIQTGSTCPFLVYQNIGDPMIHHH